MTTFSPNTSWALRSSSVSGWSSKRATSSSENVVEVGVVPQVARRGRGGGRLQIGPQAGEQLLGRRAGQGAFLFSQGDELGTEPRRLGRVKPVGDRLIVP